MPMPMMAGESSPDDSHLSLALNDISAAINGTLDFDQVMQSAIREASEVLGCDTAGILLDEGEAWVVRYVHGFSPEVVGRKYRADEMPHAMQAVRTQQAFAVIDALGDERVPRENLRAYGVLSMLVVPVIVRDGAIGAIFFNYQRQRVDITPAQIEFGERLARTLSLALDNARLHTLEVEARQRAEDLVRQLQEANQRLQLQAEELEVQSEELRSQNDEFFETQEALRRAQDELELRVQQRTASLQEAAHDLAQREAALATANLALHAEIEERERAEAEIRSQAAQLAEQARLLDLTYDTILVRDLNAHILFWNRGAEERYGWRQEEVLGKRSHDLLQTKFPEPEKTVYAKLLKKGRWEGELVHTRRDGKRIVVASRWALQRDNEGRPVRVLETNNDITEHKQAEQALWRNTRRLQLLHDIDRAVLAAHSAVEIAQAAAHHLRELIGCQRAAVVLFDFEAGVAERTAVDVTGETRLPAGTRTPLSEYVIPEGHQQGRLFSVSDLRDVPEPTPLMAAFLKEGLRSYISVPLLVQRRLIGNLNLAWDRPAAFTLPDAEIAQQVGDSLAVAIEQARLHERERRARRTAETLRAANQALTQSLVLDDVLQALLSALRELVSYTVAYVLLLEEDGCLAVRARGFGAIPVAERPGVESPARILDVKAIPPLLTTLVERQTVLIPDTLTYSGWEHMPWAGQEARSWLGVPLVAGGKALGLLSLCHSEPGAFGTEEVRIAESMAGQAAVAIQNAQLFREVDAGRRQLQALSHRLVSVQEEERRYIARELHDEAGQGLTSLLVGLGLLERSTQDESLAERVRGLKQTANQVMEELHRLALHLRPAALDRLGLVPALRQYVETFVAENGLEGEFVAVGFEDERPAPDLEITVYRAVQEALTNVARHAQATRVGVVLERRPVHAQGETPASGEIPPSAEPGGHILAIVEDNGQGFDPVEAAQRGRLGLFGMQERAQMLGGTFTVESTPGQGTTVYLEVPYVRRNRDA